MHSDMQAFIFLTVQIYQFVAQMNNTKCKTFRLLYIKYISFFSVFRKKFNIFNSFRCIRFLTSNLYQKLNNES